MKTIHTSIIVGVVLTSTIITGAAEPAHAKRTYQLHSQRKPGDTDLVVGKLEVSGNLKEVVEQKVKQTSLSVQCDFTYDEKTLDVPNGRTGQWRSARYYDKLDATIQAGDEKLQPELPAAHRLIVVEIESPEATLFSPAGPLSREELDLLEVLADSLLLDQLLPEQPVAIGESWNHSPELAAALMGLDAVSQSDLHSVLKEVTDTVARMELSGKIEGALGGVSTEIEVMAKYRFDLRTKRIDWMGMLVKEQRSIGHIERGVDAVTRYQVQITPKAGSSQLADSNLQKVSLRPSAEFSRLRLKSADNGWQIAHDRGWYVVGDRRELTILRRVDRGELVAQCNISSLAKVPPGKQLTLEEFQRDVKEALGESFGEFVQAGQWADDNNYRVFRVVVRGMVSELPIQWAYYLIADEEGHQAAIAFTVEQRLLERFQSADEELIRSFQFLEPKLASSDRP